MDDQPKRDGVSLTPTTAARQREVMQLWQRSGNGMNGERGGLPETPDDPVAYKLLDAAGDAIARGDWQQATNILRLVVKDFRHSQEAACARTVIDRLSESTKGRGG